MAVRAAVLVIGEPRGLAHPWVWGSIHRNVISALGAESDVVLCLKLETNGGQSLSTMMSVACRLNATLALTWRNGTDPETAVGGHAGQNCSLSQAGKGLWRFAIRGRQLRDCWETVRALERRRGIAYTHVVKLRADEQVCEPLPPLSRVRTDAISTWACPDTAMSERHVVNDHLAVVPRKLADVFFSQVDEATPPTRRCLPRSLWEGYCHRSKRLMPDDVPEECALTRWLAKHHTPVDTAALGAQRSCLWSWRRGEANMSGTGSLCFYPRQRTCRHASCLTPALRSSHSHRRCVGALPDRYGMESSSPSTVNRHVTCERTHDTPV